MKISKNHATTLRNSIEHWKNKGLIDENTASSLHQDIEIQTFDWKRLTKYLFWVALICLITSVTTLLADEALMALLNKIFQASHALKFVGASVLAALIFSFGAHRRKKHPQKIFSNEAILFLGVLMTAGAIYQLGRLVDSGTGHFSVLLFLSFIVYGLIGFFLKSNLVWIFSLISLGSWMGTETGYMSGWGAYYLGMNYPLRFVLFGGVLTAVALLLEKKPRFEAFFRSTFAMGMLYLFVALWIMSIFGNYGDLNSWRKVNQIELFHWSLIFGLVSAGAIYHGLRYDNGMSKGFGITFLLINLYTRFFEHFWETTHKAFFFGLLGLSLWFLGSRAEKIWHLGEEKPD